VKKALLAFIAGCALVALAGCGSSESSSSTETTTVTVGGRTTTAVIANGKTVTKPSSSGLHASTAPSFATPGAGEPVQSATVQIAYRNIAIAPDVLRVRAGSTLKWTSYDAVAHNVTSKGGPSSFASGNFGEGKTFEVKATRAGVIHYECTNHPATMNGTIEVIG
jgi:plastocyanin